MARDLILVHGFNSRIERGTRDVDFGINVESWSEFTRIREHLIREGFTEDSNAVHRLYYEDSQSLPWEIDIIPFGAVENSDSIISWPPEHAIKMSVLGFEEAARSSIKVKISKEPETIIPVASPVGICLLKLVAWLDRSAEKRPKDASDIKYLIETFHKIPVIFDELYEHGYMEAQQYDQTKASAMKLGHDVGVLASDKTKEYLEKKLFSDPTNIESLAREMSNRREYAFEECHELIKILIGAARA